MNIALSTKEEMTKFYKTYLNVDLKKLYGEKKIISLTGTKAGINRVSFTP